MSERTGDAWGVQAARYALLSEVVLLIAKTPRLDRLLAGAVGKIKWVIDFDRCVLGLVEEGGERYRLQSLMDSRRGAPRLEREGVPLTEGLPGAVIRSRQMRLIRDLAEAREELPPPADPAMADGSLGSVLALPLNAYDRTLGAIVFAAARRDAFADEDLKVATTFAAHLALAIDRWQQTRRLEAANARLKAEVVERERAEREAHDARRAAEEATHAKSDFLAKMSHELRTPLNAIIGYSEMLLEDAEDAGETETLADLRKIRGAGKHLLGLINDVLDLSKIEAGRMELYVAEFDVGAMIADVAAVIAPLAAQNENALTVDCASDIGQMRSDEMKVRQNLFNLLSNACKFTREGSVSLSVQRVAEDLVFRVADSGVGMTEEQLSRVFDSFAQADAGTSRRFGGTGLGLAITRHFCDLLGGEITVESTYGEGTVFTIRLPAAIDAEAAGPATTSGETTDRGTVLMVDDDAAVHVRFGKALAAEGYRVIHAYGGDEAIRLAREHRPDLITLDIVMPQRDGWSVLKDLKATPDLGDIPVVMVTVMGDADLGYALGAAAFLTKPVETARLLELVERHRGDGESGEILIVDDDPAVRATLGRALRRDGWRVVEAGDGREALEKLRRLRPRLILLDLIMPRLDGFEVMEALARDEALARIPVVVVTARDLTRDEAERLRGHVEKVFKKGGDDRRALLDVIRERIGRPDAGERTS